MYKDILLFEDIIDIVLFMNADMTIIAVNKAAVNAYEYTKEELLHMKIKDLMKLETGDLITSKIREAELNGVMLEGIHRTKSGKLFPVEISVKTVKIENEDIIISIIRNNSERNKIEVKLNETLEKLDNTKNQLIQNEKMASIGYLSSGVAHEINNPLGFVSSNFGSLKKYVKTLKSVLNEYKEIKCYAEAVNDEFMKELQSKIDEIGSDKKLDFIFEDLNDLFDDTSDGLKRISDIVKGLRNFAHNANQDAFEEYDLNDGIKNTLIISRNEIKYTAEIKEELNDIPNIEAIPGHVNQVILNLIINAVQAIKAKAEAQLGLIKITTNLDKGYVYCTIEDSGIGIPNENIDKIFLPFFTTKPVGQGTGLGLSISYDIIKNKHHGEILVESKIGKGTTFTLKLPIKQPNA